MIIAFHLFPQEKQEHYRQAVLNNLWAMLNKDGGVLIVVEKGHPRGFEAVAHVRQTLLDRYLLPQSGLPRIDPEDFNPAYHRELEPGHIVAPCTNHDTCPMYKVPGKSTRRKDYCHFSQRFVRPEFYNRILGKTRTNQGEVQFSYVAMQRGVSRAQAALGDEATSRAFEGYENSSEPPDMLSLPRIIMPPLKRKGHVTLDVYSRRMTERWTVPKSFSNLAYHDARKSSWGDLWALGAKTRVHRNVRTGSKPTDEEKRAAAEGKKPRRRDATMSGDTSAATLLNRADNRRRPATKQERQRDRVQEMLQAEAEEEAREIAEEVMADLAKAEEEHETRRGQ